jgi:hypothetical protein
MIPCIELSKVQSAGALQFGSILWIAPEDAAETVLAGATLAAPAIPVKKPPVTIAATVINAAFRASSLMCIVPPE